ncbi:helix-turn-helix transcriptional regulator [Marispirochaeta sp.]|jgi:DNA-binding CsgD family transcriptional regulator|uniref:helix-turn-helix transcriptional regulator n=1 Tax=Marispirochaeta sp. TaxID=2038653 RepID=UPI0029C8A248|nr:helix-turn-helix transcriptional regulator [Marispirochaeta sp.]
MSSVQRRIGCLFASIGLAAAIVNMASIAVRAGFFVALRDFRVYLVLVFSLLILFTAGLRFRIAKWIQTFLPLLVGTIAVFDDYESIYGLGLYAVSFIIALKHGLLRRGFKLKLSVYLFYVLTTVIVASGVADPEYSIGKGINAVLYLLLVGVLLFFIYADEIKRYVAFSKRQTAYIRRLKREQKKRARQFQDKLADLSEQVEGFRRETEPFDLDSRGITAAEKRVLRALIEYGGSNVELSQRLGISRSTVKAHLASIFDKMGADNRWAVIDLCRYNTWDTEDKS